jgi:indole-3-glycerol phosphate synthase
MTEVRTGTILDRILDRTRIDVTLRKERQPVAELEAAAASGEPALSLREALLEPGVSIIAEIKRASPSRGTFPIDIEPAIVAAEYGAGGAAAISVLTDEPFFQGSLGDLERAAEVAHASQRRMPVLRKDFIVDPYQIVEARAYGADAILLIVAALDDEDLTWFLAFARELGMGAVVEVHDEEEMARAAAVGAEIMGINNRDLKTFTIDLAVTEQLAPLAPAEAILVAESGIFGPAEMERVELAGADAVLVGEGLIVQQDRVAAMRALRSRSGGTS